MKMFSLNSISKGVQSRMNQMVKDGPSKTRAWLNRQAYSVYQKAQAQRFETENQSEGRRWKQVKRDYRIQKIRDKQESPNAYPGGDRILIYTGALSRSVVGTSKDNHRKVVTDRKLTVATTLEYAGFVAQVRPFMRFGQETRTDFRNSFIEYMRKRIKAELKGAR